MSLSEQDKNTILSMHNSERRAVNPNAPAVVWDDDLAASAQAWVDGRGATSSGGHDKGRGPVGENMAWGMGSGSVAYGVQLWLNEKSSYQWQPVGYPNNYGHYTQMIWKMSDRIGAGWTQTPQGWALCCRYKAAGNLPGKRPSDTYNINTGQAVGTA